MNGYGMNRGYLEVRNGSLSNMTFPLQQTEITLGRKDSNDIVIPDTMVSGQHARITIRPDAILLDDLGSSNGTIVNGMKVQSHILQEGDHIFLGSTELIFHAGEMAPASALVPAAAVAGAVMVPGGSAGPKGSKKVPIIIGSIVGICIIIITLIAAIFVFKGKEDAKDKTAPEVSVIKPGSGEKLEMPIRSGATMPLEIEVKADDDTGVDKVELYVDGKRVTLFTSDDTSPYKYVFEAAAPKDYSIYAVAYDAAANEADSNTVNVTVWLDEGKKMAVETYVTQVDACISQFNQGRIKLNQFVSKGNGINPLDPSGYTAWYEVYVGLESVNNGFRNLQASVAGFSPPGQLTPAQAELVAVLAAAVSASDSAMQWARSKAANLPDANAHYGRYSASWLTCDAHRASFNSIYEQLLLSLLGRPPLVRF